MFKIFNQKVFKNRSTNKVRHKLTVVLAKNKNKALKSLCIFRLSA